MFLHAKMSRYFSAPDTMDLSFFFFFSLQIGADGAQSAVRTAARFHTVGWSYKQTAVVATLQLSEVAL